MDTAAEEVNLKLVNPVKKVGIVCGKREEMEENLDRKGSPIIILVDLEKDMAEDLGITITIMDPDSKDQ